MFTMYYSIYFNLNKVVSFFFFHLLCSYYCVYEYYFIIKYWIDVVVWWCGGRIIRGSGDQGIGDGLQQFDGRTFFLFFFYLLYCIVDI